VFIVYAEPIGTAGVSVVRVVWNDSALATEYGVIRLRAAGILSSSLNSDPKEQLFSQVETETVSPDSSQLSLLKAFYKVVY
jgi:hypothetical protein